MCWSVSRVKLPGSSPYFPPDDVTLASFRHSPGDCGITYSLAYLPPIITTVSREFRVNSVCAQSTSACESTPMTAVDQSGIHRSHPEFTQYSFSHLFFSVYAHVHVYNIMWIVPSWILNIQ